MQKKGETAGFKNQLGIQEVIYRNVASSEFRCLSKVSDPRMAWGEKERLLN